MINFLLKSHLALIMTQVIMNDRKVWLVLGSYVQAE